MAGKLTAWISSIVKGDASEAGRLTRPLQEAIDLSLFVYRKVIKDNCTLHAKSLTYTTLLSIVPVLVVILSLFEAFGGLEDGKERLIEFLSANIVAEQSTQVVSYITAFSENLKSATVSVVGILFLLWVAVSFLSTIEGSFNQIWDSGQQRSIKMRFLIFWPMVTIGPVLVVSSISITAAIIGTDVSQQFQEMPIVGGILRFLIPFIPTWIALSALYWFIPNTRVKVRAALVGGLVGGMLFEVVKVLFATYVVLVASSKYGRVYGSFAAVPIFMISLYITWLCVLFGSEVSYVAQHFGIYKEQKKRISRMEDDPYVAIRLVHAIAEQFTAGAEPYSAHDIARQLEFSHAQVTGLLDRLETRGVLLRIEGKRSGYVPARSLDTISLGDVVEAVQGKSFKIPPQRADKVSNYLQGVFQRFNESASSVLDSLSFQQAIHEIARQV